MEQIESEVNEGHHIITQEEALQLAWAKNDIREKEKELKKITPRQVWRDMLAIQHKSLMEDKQRREKARLAKNRAITKRDEMVKNVVGVLFIAVLGGAVWYAIEVMKVLGE